MRGRRVRCNAMFGDLLLIWELQLSCTLQEALQLYGGDLPPTPSRFRIDLKYQLTALNVGLRQLLVSLPELQDVVLAVWGDALDEAVFLFGHRISWGSPNGQAFSGEPSERSERPERMRGWRVRCNAMLGGTPPLSHQELL